MSIAADPIDGEAVWQDAECGSYVADLPLWERLAAGAGPVLDLGAGGGRVALHLAALGHRVLALDSDPELLGALRARASDRGLAIETINADARELQPSEPCPLIIAPMQLLHLLGGPEGRAELLARLALALPPGGRFYAALLDDRTSLRSGPPDPLPDVRERSGWVHSSLPLDVVVDETGIEVHRLRQLVSPSGELSERRSLVRLDPLSPAELEDEGLAAGLTIGERFELPATADHVGSIVVGLEAPR